MLKRRKQKSDFNFVPSMSLAPTGPFSAGFEQIEIGDPVTVRLSRRVADYRRDRKNAWTGARY